MYSTLLSVALFSALAIQGALADFTVSTPEVTSCGSVKLTWDSTGASSYNVAIVPTDDPCNEILVDLGDHTVNHITWTNVTLKPDTQVMVSVLDSNDDEGWSGHITVKAGNDTSCLGTASSTASSAAASSTAVSVSAGSGTLTVPVANAQSAASSASSAPAAPTTSDSAEAVGAAAAGVTGGAASLKLSASTLALSAVVAFAALAF